MADFKLPNLGENLDEAQVVRVDVKAGDRVTSRDTLLALETEKAVMDVPVDFEGTIDEVLVSEGDMVKSGQTIARYSEGKGDGSEGKKEAPKDKKEGSEQKDEKDEKDEKGKEDKEDKEGKEKGKEQEEKAPQDSGSDEKTQKEQPKSEPAAKEGGDKESVPAPASPSVRKLARELGVDLNRVHGTAKDGRITESDLKAYVKQALRSKEAGNQAAAVAPPLPDFAKWGPVREEALKGVRKATAGAMARSWSLIPHVTQHDEADITGMEEARRRLVAGRKGRPGKVTMTVLAAKACARVLKEFPEVNASLDMEAGKIIFKDYYHIGIAVDSEHGLMVPVIRDVDQKEIVEIARVVEELAAKVRNRTISMDEMQGAGFTISNLGGIGGTAFTPIVNWPQAAILGISRAQRRVILDEGQPDTRLILPVSLSYDHRLIDGAAAARFTRRLCELLESPLELMVGGDDA